eukprot:m.255810 g.255810  ORF g.255810 m.255810 type:complete len:91 (-) comp15508_c0_seq2:1358-1630(-)
MLRVEGLLIACMCERKGAMCFCQLASFLVACLVCWSVWKCLLKRAQLKSAAFKPPNTKHKRRAIKYQPTVCMEQPHWSMFMLRNVYPTIQ